MSEREALEPKAPEKTPPVPQRVFIGADPGVWRDEISQLGIAPTKGELIREPDGWYWRLKPCEISDPAEQERARQEEEAWEI